MSSKICTLMVHNSSHNPEELLLNSEIFNEYITVNDYIRISDVNNKENILILKVSKMQTISSRLEISIIKSVAEANNLKPFSKVIIEKVNIEECSVDFVELSFKRQYLQRGNIYRLQNSMQNRPVHCNQNIAIHGVQAQIQEIRKDSIPINSGIISENTKFVFRSRSARIIWLVQISAEMWEFDQNGNLYFEKFLSEFMSPLLDLWKSLSVTHTLTIIFFSRTFYLERITSTNHPELYSKKSLSQTTDGFQYQDSFKITIENIADFDKVDKITLIKKLRQEFWEFPKTMGWKIPNKLNGPLTSIYEPNIVHVNSNSNLSNQHCNNNHDNISSSSSSSSSSNIKPCNWEVNYAVPSDAVHGNFLEAINTSLNILDKHYMDRDLLRTNNSIVMVSAGAGIYKVKHNLSQITKQRMLDNAFGLDFISLARPTIKTVPLFLVECRNEGVKNFYEIPHWMRISYVDCNKEMSESYDSRLQSDDLSCEDYSEHNSEETSKDHMWAKSFMLQPTCNLLTSIIENSGDLKKLATLYAKALPLPLKELMKSSTNQVNNMSFEQDTNNSQTDQHLSSAKEPKDSYKTKPIQVIPVWGSMKHMQQSDHHDQHLTNFNSTESRKKRFLTSSKSIFLADDIFQLKNALTCTGSDILENKNNNYKSHLNEVLEDLPILRKDYSESVGSYGSTFGETIGSKEDHSPHNFDQYHLHMIHPYSKQIHNRPSISRNSNNENYEIEQKYYGRNQIGDNSTHSDVNIQGKSKTELLMQTHLDNLSERKRILTELSKPEFELGRNNVINMMDLHDKCIFAKKGNINSNTLENKPLESVSELLKKESNEFSNKNQIENTKTNTKEASSSSTEKVVIPNMERSISRDEKLRAALVQSSNKSSNLFTGVSSKQRLSNKTTTYDTKKSNIENSLSAELRDNSVDPVSLTSTNEQSNSLHLRRNQKLTSKSFAKPVISQQKQNVSINKPAFFATKGMTTSSNINQQFTFYHGKIIPIHTSADNDVKLKSELYAKHIREYSQTHSVNPFRFKESVTYLNSLTHNRRRWAHVFPLGKSDRSVDYGLNWKSLTQPAILPLTTDYIPSIKSMDKGYDVNNFYQLLVDKSESPFVTSEDLVTEMICMRLTQEYQLIEGYDSDSYMEFINNHNNHSQIPSTGARKSNAPSMLRRMDSLQFDISNHYDSTRDDAENTIKIEKQKNFFILSMGHRIQFLQFDDTGIKVTIYRSKEGLNLDDEKSMHLYSYETWIPQINAFMTTSQTFYKFPHTEFKWNKYDNIVVGNIPADLTTLQGIKAKHLQFTIIHPEIFTEDKLVDYYTKFDLLFEFLNKYCTGSTEKFSIKKDSRILEGRYSSNNSSSDKDQGISISSTRNNAFSPTSSNSFIRDENISSTFHPIPASRLTIQDEKTSLLYQDSTSINDYDIAKLIMRTSKQGNPNWLYCKYDKTVYSYKSYHLEIYWMVCDAWLIDDFITLLYRRCQKFGLRLSQVPLYYHTEHLNIHPYRTLPLISLPQQVIPPASTTSLILSSTPKQVMDHNSSSAAAAAAAIMNQMSFSPLRMIERLVFTRNNGWLFDNGYKTDWVTLNIPIPNYSDRDRDMFVNSVHDSSTEISQDRVQNENQLTTSNNISSNKTINPTKLNPLSSLSKTFSLMTFPQRSPEDLSNTLSIGNIEKVNMINILRHNKKIQDRQYIHCSGLAVCRVAANGFLWMHNSSSKISDVNINSDEKRDVVTKHREMLSEYCHKVVICYEILCIEVINKVLNIIDEYVTIRQIIEESIDEACQISENEILKRNNSMEEVVVVNQNHENELTSSTLESNNENNDILSITSKIDNM